VSLEVSHRITRRTTRPVARVFSGSDRVEFDRSAENVEVIAISGPSLDNCSAHDVCSPQRRLHPANCVLDTQSRFDNPSRTKHLQGRYIAGVELATRFERDGRTGHVR
jgi:hypothetical protein